jgi:hypothetical protein
MMPPFLSFNLSSAIGIATFAAVRAIRRFRRQAGNIAAGALILINVLSYCIFRFFLLFSERS